MGHHTCCNRQKVKRGLWSPEEDEKLINYISTYGHGLQRCGKSYRLRWVNYLRPDLKRRRFSPQETAIIIELHRSLGNRWAQIAKHLPGRTDNEMKNFWNSSIKKKLIPHGLSDFPTFSDIPNTCNASFEGFFLSPTVSTHPNLIPSPQQHHISIPNTSSILPQGFAHHGDVLELDELNYIPSFNFGPMPPLVPLPSQPPLVPLPSQPPSYDPTCSLAYHSQHHINYDDHRREDYYRSPCHGATASTYLAAEQVVNSKMTVPPHDDDDGGMLMMPKVCGIMINSFMPSSSVNSHEAHPMASSNSLSCFPQETYTHDPHQPNVQTEYIDAIISSIN